jgi:hypothetical protein
MMRKRSRASNDAAPSTAKRAKNTQRCQVAASNPGSTKATANVVAPKTYWYYARDGETAAQISQKCNVSVDTVIPHTHIDKHGHKRFRCVANSKLKEGTAVYLDGPIDAATLSRLQMTNEVEAVEVAAAEALVARSSHAEWFHVNTYISKQAGTNAGFGAFMRAGAVSVGFQDVIIGYGIDNLVGLCEKTAEEALLDDPSFMMQSRICKELTAMQQVHGQKGSSCRQVATWLTRVKPGDIILMRHTYKNCPFLPTKLTTLDGDGYKPVFALVRVTTAPVPKSAMALARAGARLPFGDGTGIRAGIAYAKVEPIGLGFMADLEPATRRYLNSVIQPTLARLKSEREGGKFTVAIKANLEKNARIAVCCQDFAGAKSPKTRTTDYYTNTAYVGETW